MTKQQLIKLIKDMYRVDQGLRLKAKPGLELENYVIYLADASHNYWIHKIINDFGYPSMADLGQEVMKEFWLLVQHQDYDPELQQSCLDNCDFESSEREHLTDRVLINSGLPQRYGTQNKQVDG